MCFAEPETIATENYHHNMNNTLHEEDGRAVNSFYFGKAYGSFLLISLSKANKDGSGFIESANTRGERGEEVLEEAL